MGIIRGWKHFFSVDTILPHHKRLGNIPDTKTVYKTYMDVAWPATMQGLLLQLMTAVDLAMVGALGANALAAVGIMSQPKMVLLIFVRALAVAITAIIARRYGAGEYASMNSVLKQGVLLTLLVYVPLLFLSAYGIDEILLFAGAQSEYIAEAQIYGTLITWSILFSAFSQIIGAALIGIGNTKIIFQSNALGNIINTVMNYFLIYGSPFSEPLGVVGAGIATVISNIFIFVMMLYVIIGKDKILSLFDGKSWKFCGDDLHIIGHLTGSALGEQIFERFGMFAYTKMVATLGVVPLATHHVCMNLCDIFYYFAMGLGHASTSYTGRFLGQRRDDLAELYGRFGIRIGLVFSTLACLIYVLIREPFMEIYTSDVDVIALGSQIVIILALASFPQTLQLIYSGVLKGAGDNFYVMKYSFAVIAVFRPILTYLLCFTWSFGLYGAWLALLCDQSLRMFFSQRRFYGNKWKVITL